MQSNTLAGVKPGSATEKRTAKPYYRDHRREQVEIKKFHSYTYRVVSRLQLINLKQYDQNNSNNVTIFAPLPYPILCPLHLKRTANYYEFKITVITITEYNMIHMNE